MRCPIIDFKAMQKHNFKVLALKIVQAPEQYLQFDNVADFYQASWLQEFPQGTHYCATGLDDGAEAFYARIEYDNYCLYVSCGVYNSATFGSVE